MLIKQLVPTLDTNPSKDTLRLVEGLTSFITTLLKQEIETLLVYTYQGMEKGTELTNLRFQVNDQSFTFIMLASNFERFLDAVLEEESMEWCFRANNNPALQSRDCWLNLSRVNPTTDIPLHWLTTPDLVKDPFGDVTQEDFITYGNALGRLDKTINEHVKEAIGKTNTFVVDNVKRDHDLYIVFRAVDDYQSLAVNIEQVYPVLPESGLIDLGNNPLANWVNDNKASNLAFKKIQVIAKHVNRDINVVKDMVKDKPYFADDFKQWIKTKLLATSHFSKDVYRFEMEGDEALVNKVANDIVRKLTYKGGNIGLDLNSWVVWSYEQGKAPVKVTDEELDFLNILQSKYTESFVMALYNFLINLGNPYIRPYNHQVPADAKDGIEVGSIRVNK